MIRVGQKVKMNPFMDIRTYGMSAVGGLQEGVVNYVHPAHKWFSVEYDAADTKQVIGYKFFDIGKTVEII